MVTGSPAHAGIDLESNALHSTRAGLPRTRGDRPRRVTRAINAAVAPPHTRGSTQLDGAVRYLDQGSPAHAGIDRVQARAVRWRHRLPRTRGDRPPRPPRLAPAQKAPPHTRGSTPRTTRAVREGEGSPAHAGIDRWRIRSRVRLVGLPRTRGDRPSRVAPRAIDRLAPPHTRGSTRRDLVARASLRGSPAHAGIDPAAGVHSRATPRLPRTRGDRPVTSEASRSLTAAPPHTRGSTPT